MILCPAHDVRGAGQWAWCTAPTPDLPSLWLRAVPQTRRNKLRLTQGQSTRLLRAHEDRSRSHVLACQHQLCWWHRSAREVILTSPTAEESLRLMPGLVRIGYRLRSSMPLLVPTAHLRRGLTALILVSTRELTTQDVRLQAQPRFLSQ
jgi:hypothetical protein